MYDAFISYSHAEDKPLATALQPVIQTLGKPWWRRRTCRVFRDDTSLSTTPGLWPAITEAFDNSRFMILLASPQAAASEWVSKEVEHWLANKSTDTLLIALTARDLTWHSERNDFDWHATIPLPKRLEGAF